MYDDSFQEDLDERRNMERVARRVLGVDEGVSAGDLRRAWRGKCLEHHPDRNPGDPDAERKLVVVNCAYEFLKNGTPGAVLLERNEDDTQIPGGEKYNLDNAWGLFLWWRDRFF